MVFPALFCLYTPLVITQKSSIRTYTPLTLPCQGHAIVSDGLFRKTGTFYVMPDVDLKPLEEIFCAKVFTMLKEEGKIDDDIIKKLMDWRHSGFRVHNKARIARDDEKGRVALAQYIILNRFSLEKLAYNQEADTVIYRSKMSQGKNKKNFQIYTAEEFIAAITQHIPEKSFQACTELVEVWCVTNGRTCVPACHHNVGRGRPTYLCIQTNLVVYEKNRTILRQTINRLIKLIKPLR